MRGLINNYENGIESPHTHFCMILSTFFRMPNLDFIHRFFIYIPTFVE